jgi:hypothetical protein
MTICVEDLERMDFSDVARGDKLPPVPPGEISDALARIQRFVPTSSPVL